MKPALPQPAYRIELLERFTSVNDIDLALNNLADYLAKENYERALTDLLEHPLTLELALSGIRDSVPLTSWIFEDFPTSPSVYDASIASKLLNHLSLFFVFHEVPVPVPGIEDNREAFSRLHHLVTATPQLLYALSALQFGDEQGERVELDDDDSLFFIKIKKGRKKRSKRGANEQASRSKATLDPRILPEFGILTPRSRKEAEEAVSTVLTGVKMIIEVR
ncbi:hypothetical protein C0991_008409 [Blastosporella zonata]|nr:hypothetical protein C0991_008409 [Blastosporella zonata]